jgi:hypothetical protein
MNKQIFSLIALLALSLAFGCQKEESALSPADDAIEERNGNPNARVFPPNARPYGKSQAEWSQDWWNHMWSFGCGNFPLFPDSDAYQASLNTDGPVIFLPGTFSSPPVSRSITVPHGKAIMFPLVNVVWIYSACYESAAEDEALANGTLVEYITSFIDPILSGPDVNISATLDGVAFNNLRNYRFTSSGLYDFDVHDELADCLGDPCLSADDLLGFADGYWLTLKPLSRGQHTLNFQGEIEEVGLSVNVTYYITVE